MDEPGRWEYRVETLGSALRGPSDEDLETELDQLGLEGWEALAVLPREGSYRVTAVLKRAVAGARR
jgi:hypothetical protein